MGKIVLLPELKTVKIEGAKKRVSLLDNTKYDLFNPFLLGLGDVALPSVKIESIAAVFDLSGFTTFCSQVDPHLAVPEYLSRFLNWLFRKIKSEFVEKEYAEGKKLWANLPFLAKFTGDGVLFLWNTLGMSGEEICNVVVTLNIICDDYVKKFYPYARKTVTNPPDTLRCGIARGTVFSVGNGEDYVGPCINIATRLQKLSLLSFCVSRRGFDFKKHMDDKVASDFKLKSVVLRGIGNDELVWVLKNQLKALPEQEKTLFKDP
jgi:class 3 adenylate cyclase